MGSHKEPNTNLHTCNTVLELVGSVGLALRAGALLFLSLGSKNVLVWILRMLFILHGTFQIEGAHSVKCVFSRSDHQVIHN